jgi:hypothetical protein
MGLVLGLFRRNSSPAFYAMIGQVSACVGCLSEGVGQRTGERERDEGSPRLGGG